MTVKDRVRQQAPTSVISAAVAAGITGLLGWQNASELSDALERAQVSTRACHESSRAILLEFTRFVAGGPADVPAHPHPSSTHSTPTVEDPW